MPSHSDVSTASVKTTRAACHRRVELSLHPILIVDDALDAVPCPATSAHLVAVSVHDVDAEGALLVVDHLEQAVVVVVAVTPFEAHLDHFESLGDDRVILNQQIWSRPGRGSLKPPGRKPLLEGPLQVVVEERIAIQPWLPGR